MGFLDAIKVTSITVLILGSIGYIGYNSNMTKTENGILKTELGRVNNVLDSLYNCKVEANSAE